MGIVEGNNFCHAASDEPDFVVLRGGIKFFVSFSVSPNILIEYPRFNIWQCLLKQHGLFDCRHASDLAAVFFSLVFVQHAASYTQNKSPFRWRLSIRRT